MPVAAKRQRRSGGGERGSGADAVGEVGLGQRAHADGRPRPGQQLDVARGQVGGVHHRRARAERARRVEHLGRGRAERRPALGVLERLLGQVRVDRRPVRVRPRHHLRHLVRGDRANRVDRRAEPGVRRHHAEGVAGEPGDPLRPGGRRAVAEPELNARQRQRLSAGQEPARQVAGVKQGDPQAGCGRGRDQHPAHLVRVAVALSAGAVMEIVELPDAGDPGQRHLRVDGAGEREVGAGVEPLGDRVHAVPPGPERVACRRRAGPSPLPAARRERRAARGGTRASARWPGPGGSAREAGPCRAGSARPPCPGRPP